ncbi:MAG: PSD1 and planctomycete cytochrome C domain-containing protein, partial [Verrucomicrobia bacterium]|nr:PSD1 and planctomycete cytochrome C domain-containing protein [Verrucomicrobiota bacterium]
MRLLSSFVLLSLTVCLSAAEKISFNRDIRPILSDKCFACHGPDAKKRKADLRLDSFQGATEGGEFATPIVPGKPEDSELIVRILETDPDEIMPPPESHKKLDQREIGLIREWIKQGAPYEAHWSYTPLKRPVVPTPEKFADRVANPIDAFILHRLEAKNLTPSPKASNEALFRRLSLDLTGLPPSAFDQSTFPDPTSAIDMLMASPAYGERMAVPWLDVARYADTVGYHGDQNQRIFPYRDYVINAFNNNKPFDQFVREQLAGDLLPDPTDEQLIATGFTRLNLITREGGSQVKEYLAKYAADRVRSVGAAFLGQTTGCAECHDHKFDPISSRDFYSLAAFFADVQQWGIYDNYAGLNPPLAGFDNDSPFPPEFFSPSASRQARITTLQHEAIRTIASTPADDASIQQWTSAINTYAQQNPDGWRVLPVQTSASQKATPLEPNPDHSVLIKGPATKGDQLTFHLGQPDGSIGSFRLEALPDDAHDGHIGRSDDGRFSVSPKFFLNDKDNKLTPIKIAWSQADLDTPPGFRNGDRPSVSFGEKWTSAPGKLIVPADLSKHLHTAVFCLDAPLTIPADSTLVVQLTSDDIGRVRFATSPTLNPVPGQPAFSPAFREALADNPAGQRAAFHLCNTPVETLPADYRTLLDSIRDCRAGWAYSMVAQSVDPLPIRILKRGDWQDDSGDLVEPAVLHFLPSDSLPKDRRLTRLDLADWIVAEENPLPARHFMNRLWKQFFGTGLSNVLDDLGGQGEWPAHPELLDWLASEFRESGWDIKHMVRLIVTSNTYQQEAAKRADLAEIDPYNRLYAQQGARRLDAEFIRDNALAIAGLLNHSYTGGPSIAPYQPAGYYTPLNFPQRDYPVQNDDRQYRRGVYMHWQRTFLHPMLANFDAPGREECAADRLQANSPQQALTLLNDPSFVEAARVFAVDLLSDPALQNNNQRLAYAFHRTLGREAKPEELKGLQDFHTKQIDNFTSGRDDPAKFLSIGLAKTPDSLDP